MFPSLAARETCVAEPNFAARKQKMFLPWSQSLFLFIKVIVAAWKRKLPVEGAEV